ncbi:winged helix-turn-helix domain-containing protein [Tahibacter harae]|uniref:Winged helix-turn-helix domain-containing protein n=1 Tax=Tahibacter harae TaxID=2963937 RepID=A0ABT1QQW0_9GAMM|nr:winged helix-turn-helix domain-containing protein [Tahibacter harae]MCQ4164650.1 winged helix-turn-helix domain-containing protein [Tahibacter harae]
MPHLHYRFGEFDLDPAARELRRGTERVELPGSAFDGLVYLIAQRDRAVGRDELMAAIWGRADVADSLLGQTLVRLRRALGDNGETQQWIRTVPRFGYRWVGELREEMPGEAEAVAADAAAAAATAAGAATTAAIAVRSTTATAADAVAAATAASAATATDAGQPGPKAAAAAPVTTPTAAAPAAVAAPEVPAAVAAPPVAAAPGAASEAAAGAAPPVADPSVPTAAPLHPPAPAAAPRQRPAAFLLAAAAFAAALAALLFVHLAGSRRTAAPDAAVPAALLTAPALVLPAQVKTGPEWEWLRLGLMDLIAGRLRRGDLATAASESVVAVLREHADVPAEALLDLPGLAGADSLRILPEVEQQQGRWLLRLHARDRSRRFVVETRADDAISAAREAADILLLRLGHLPPAQPEDKPQELTELLQRTRAAMLADQLQLAGELIARADPALRERPEIVLRQANVELRAGAYLAVEQRLLHLLDQIPPERDAELRGRALVTLAASYIRRERPADAERYYEEAIQLLHGSTASDALGIALLGRGLVATLREDYASAMSDLGQARGETETAGNPLGTAQVDLNLALIEVRRLRPATALPMLVDVAARFERLGAQEEYVFSIASIAEVQQLLLDHQGALATIARCWPPQEHSANPRLRWKISLVRAEALLETGQVEAADQLAQSIVAGADSNLDAPALARTTLLQARLAAARGDAAASAGLARAALTPVLQANDSVRYVQAWLLQLRGLRGSGRLAEAAQETARLGDWVKQHPAPWRQAYADLAQAEQYAAEDRHEPALARFDQALRLIDAAGAIPDDVVEVIQPYAALLVRDGRLDQARALSARIAPWSERDLRAATVLVQINSAPGRSEARQSAEQRALQLAGERRLIQAQR